MRKIKIKHDKELPGEEEWKQDMSYHRAINGIRTQYHLTFFVQVSSQYLGQLTIMNKK